MRQIVENASKKTLSRIESTLLAERPLKLKGLNRNTFIRRRKRSLILQDILKKVQTTDTLYADNYKIECDYRHMRRSFGDLYRVMRYYCPDLTFKEFRALLFGLVNDKKVCLTYCGTIRKRVMYLLGTRYSYRDTSRDIALGGEGIRDELGLTLKVITNENIH